MKFICTILMAFLALAGYAQSYNPANVNKKALKLNDDAMQQANDGNFKEAIHLLENAVKIDSRYLDAWLSIAGMYSDMKNYGEAIRNYETGRAIDSEYFKDYNLSYSISLAGIGAFDKALKAVDEFLSIPNLSESSLKFASYRKRCYQFAIDYAQNNPVTDYRFEPRNLGDSVNSNVSEYFPALTIDGKRLIFTRKVRGLNEDFYETFRKDSSWTLAKPLEGNINTNYNEGAQSISQDGQWLIFTGCNFPEGYGSCDLYISYNTPDGWSVPENMGGKINSESWESAPSLSPDKRDLYFASTRPGGYGGSDIYVSHRLPNGRWSEPENMGPEINTVGDERSPFIHADNQTLYFTSNGHLGYGGDDIFLSRKGAKGKWGPVKNLGYPINTIENEGSLFITADGATAYYASDRSDSRGGLDLYTFEIRSDVRPIRTLWVKGKVFDKKTKNGLPSAVELTDLTTREIVSKVQTDETGNYLITLPVGRDYAFNVNRRGYLFFSGNFPLSEKTPDSTYNIDIPLQPLEANATIVLHNIFFDINKYELKPESQVELDNLVKLLKENPTLKIQINGHTDNVGKPADNLSLSDNRAKAVVQYLTSKGIEPGRLSSQGFGATQPVADNTTEEGRAQNRRTELKVVSQ
ncbi:MAG TPA: OmpA family protein [Chitinophagaceae bacterium]|jgi:outer membrane protein OmpA-like peptidoglycan-associated protein/tetratricopeptide (TPR) repeat protein